MDLNLLKTFIKVADCGSLTKASKLLNHPKSKISRDLVKLEDELQQTLLLRTPRGIKVTEQGLNLLQYTRSKLEDLESSIQEVVSIPHALKGKIRLTASEDLASHLLVDMISEFLEIYPEVSIDLLSTTEFLDFQKNNIDLALRFGRLEDSALIQKKIADVDTIYVASTQYIKSSSKVSGIQDFKKHEIAIIKDSFGNSLNQGPSKNFNVRFSTNSMGLLKQFISENKGIATLPSFLCQEELASKKFTRVLDNQLFLKSGLYLLSAPVSYSPKHVKEFKDFIYTKLKTNLSI